MRTIGNGRIRRVAEGISYGTGASIKQLCDWDMANDDDIATIETAGYFNDLASQMNVGEIIKGRVDLNGTPVLMEWMVAANTGTVVTVVRAGAGEIVLGQAPRAAIPTADGLTTGLILPTDNAVTATSANAAHIMTLPAIALLPFGWDCWIFPGNATGYNIRTVAASNTTINNGDADGTAQMAVATTLVAHATKLSATNFMVECYAPAGTRTIPTPA